jgi:hypothetical protein
LLFGASSRHVLSPPLAKRRARCETDAAVKRIRARRSRSSLSRSALRDVSCRLPLGPHLYSPSPALHVPVSTSKDLRLASPRPSPLVFFPPKRVLAPSAHKSFFCHFEVATLKKGGVHTGEYYFRPTTKSSDSVYSKSLV